MSESNELDPNYKLGLVLAGLVSISLILLTANVFLINEVNDRMSSASNSLMSIHKELYDARLERPQRVIKRDIPKSFSGEPPTQSDINSATSLFISRVHLAVLSGDRVVALTDDIAVLE